MTPDNRIEELAAEARYHRERLQLYRARVHTSRPTTLVRLRELERLSDFAVRRLRLAEEEALNEQSRNYDGV
jgi:hypothetical protein